MTKPSMQIDAAAVVPEKKATAVGRRGVDTTEEQARAIIATAKRAVEEAKTIKKTRANGAGTLPSSSSSLKRSLECFLDGRKNKAMSSAATRRHLQISTASSSSTSSN